MPYIKIKNCSVEFPILDERSNSIRRTLLKKLVPAHERSVNQQNTKIALNNISLSIENGDSVGVFGHNGSGKTSLLRLISGIYTPTAGSLSIEGRIRSLLALGIGAEPSLSGRENILRVGLLNGFAMDEILGLADEIIEFSELKEAIDLPIRVYSAGMTMRLFFSILTAKSTDILAMDEFFSTGDEAFLKKSADRIEAMINDAKVLIIASNSRVLLQKYCNRFVIMDGGYLAEVSPEQFMIKDGPAKAVSV